MLLNSSLFTLRSSFSEYSYILNDFIIAPIHELLELLEDIDLGGI